MKLDDTILITHQSINLHHKPFEDLLDFLSGYEHPQTFLNTFVMVLVKFGALKMHVHNVWYIGTCVLQFEFHVLENYGTVHICTLHLST